MIRQPETAVEAETLLNSLIASRRGKLGSCTRKLNEIKALLVEGGNVDHVIEYMDIFKQAVGEFTKMHESVQRLLSEDKKLDDHADWYEPRMMNFSYFLEEVETWKRQQSTQWTVKPQDSISNASKASKSSSTSSKASSAAKLASAEKAALQARSAALQEKHALQLEETIIKSKMEKVELDAQIAAADAKLKVLLSNEEGEPCGNAMNEYYEEASKQVEPTFTETSALEFIQVAAVPKTPLQRTVDHFDRSSRRTTKASSPQLDIHETNTSHYNLDTLVQTQKDIAELVIMQQNLSLLPKRDVPVYDGNPLSYQSFMHAFKYLIEDKTDSCQDRLYFLEQFTSGQAKELVRSCLHMDARRGYSEAMQLLKKHFGNEMRIANAYLDKALNWTVIKAEDGKSLHAYALYLKKCCNAMQDLEYMDELDVTSNLKRIASKLPYKLRERWRTKAYESFQKTNTRARFKHLVDFIEAQSNILLHPVFGDIKEPTPVKQMISNFRTPKRSSSFVTTVKAAEEGNTKSQAAKEQQQPETHLVISSLCNFCQGKHALVDCLRLKSEPQDKKIECLRRTGHCFGCLKRGHMSRDCKNRLDCQICQRKHPTLLHTNGRSLKQEALQNLIPTEPKETSINSALVSADKGTGAGKECALAIVPVQVKVAKGDKCLLTYAFLDPGSSATFCTENLMERLNAKGRKTEILLRTMGQERPVRTYELTGLQVGNLDGSGYVDLPKVFTQAKIPVSKESLLTQSDLEKWPHLSGIQLKEINADIEILIGMDIPKAMEPWKVINSQGNGPYAVETILGWVVNGPLNSAMEESGTSVSVNRISIDILRDLLVQQYNQEFPEKEYEETREMSGEDRRFMDLATSSIVFRNGHYHLPLPFRDKNVVFPNNYEVAAQRTLNLAKKFQKDVAYAAEYKTFMDGVLCKGYAQKVPPEQLQRSDGHVWYIPHHGVHHKQKKKLRVVFDCSSSYRGKSLNGELLQGPDLANPLLGILLRFRQNQIAIMADIESMYYQVRVPEEHRDFLRFLWWPQGDVTKPLEVYQMNVHLFGAVSSPSVANFALQQTGRDSSDKFSMDVLDTIKRSFYVDDCLTSVPSTKQAVMLTKGLREACALGGFTLTKWISNSLEVLTTVPESHRAKLVKQLDLDREKPPLERALGIQWNIHRDTFTFTVAVKSRAPTRRAILSTVSSIYDPLGFLSPFILKAKQILQELCIQKRGWDEIIPEEISKLWQRWITDLDQLSRFEVKRCMKPQCFGAIRTAELHHFCDASESGYGTVSYLRFTNHKGDVHVAFVLGKSRVTPLKQITIPRLELAAATLAVKVDRMLQRELQMKLKNSIFWTDSTSVLKYIHNQTKRFHTYVANRIAVIQNLSQEHQWKHVGSKDNPADDASRGLHIESFLSSTRWLNGPDFLSGEETVWPKVPQDLGTIPLNDPEVKKDITVNCLKLDNAATSSLIDYYSSWRKLLRAIGWLLKLRKVLRLKCQVTAARTRSKLPQQPQNLSVEDLDKAEKSVIGYEQRRYFESELALLNRDKPVKMDSSISKLDPMIDEEGILRVGGRLSKAAMPVNLKNPIILPKDSHVSKLILRDIHQSVGHSGRNHMLSRLGQKFWLPSANSSARKIIKACIFCRRVQARVGEQKMADLPQDRITPDLPPFSHVGIDYFGPLEVKRGRSQVKRWGVIFTCLASRAVHLEVASTLDTDSCINAIRRFLCRRGPISTIRTDCGTNFVGAQRELRAALTQLDHQKINNALLTNEVKWIFNSPHGAHFGGVWERLISLVKKVLSSVLKQQILDDETLLTALCEVESILNDRPITTVSTDPNDLEPLTPNHLLQLNSKPLLPPGLFCKDDLYCRKRWKQVQYLANLFWQRWSKEYLSLMQQRQKWIKTRRNLEVNDVVIIVDDTAPRNSWPLGRVVKTLPGAKGLVRNVLVQTKTGIRQRPIDKLCLLLEGEN